MATAIFAIGDCMTKQKVFDAKEKPQATRKAIVAAHAGIKNSDGTLYSSPSDKSRVPTDGGKNVQVVQLPAPNPKTSSSGTTSKAERPKH
jgi:hypothetical protein